MAGERPRCRWHDVELVELAPGVLDCFYCEQAEQEAKAQVEREARERYEAEQAELVGYHLTWGDEG